MRRKNEFQNYRKQHKLTQSDITRAIGMPLTTYSTKENGFTEFTLSEAFAIATFLKISVEDLFSMLTSWE